MNMRVLPDVPSKEYDEPDWDRADCPSDCAPSPGAATAGPATAPPTRASAPAPAIHRLAVIVPPLVAGRTQR